jgi:Mg2+ and Co2+ transporter CorA
VSDSDWYNPCSWGSTKTVYSTHYRTVNYTYANVHDSVSKLEDFVLETERNLYEASHKILDLASFKDEIKQAIKGLFDFSDENFDPQMILLPLGNAVDRITIPSIHLDLDHHINTIREQFDNSEVEGDEIEALRNEQARVVTLVMKEIAAEVHRSKKDMLAKLDKEEHAFIPSLTKDLHANVAQLKQDLKNREQSLQTYKQILNQLNTDLLSIVYE